MRSLVDVGVPTLPPAIVFERGDVDGKTGWLRLRAVGDVRGFATGWFARPAAYVELSIASGGPGTLALGFAFTQFAMPVVAGSDLDFDFAPAPNLHSPPAVGLLLVVDGDRCTLLAPLTNVHEQVLAVEGGRLLWGWHGDLDEAPEGFETTLGVYTGASPSEVLARWGAEVRGERPPRPALTTPPSPICRTGPTTAPRTGTEPNPAARSAGV